MAAGGHPATGIGRRPTVDAANAPVTCETYVPGYHGDTYGQTPVLEFHHYLCAVRKFGTLQELADLTKPLPSKALPILPQRRKRNAP